MIMFLHQPIHFALRDSIPSEPVLALVAVTISMLAHAVVKRARLPSMILLGHSLARGSPVTQG